jgi:signal transduction histidine kinase
VFDVLITLLFASVSTLLIAVTLDGVRASVIAGVVAGVHVAPLFERRRRPLLAVGVMAAAALVSVPLGVPVVVLGPAALVGVFTVGALVEPVRSRSALALIVAAMTVVVLGNGMDAGTLVTNAAALWVAWWLGDRQRRANAAIVSEKAVAADIARRTAAAERLQIARELHDVVAHAMSVIAVQAGTGRFVIDESPEIAKSALSTIETTSRRALDEMRRLLSVLRDEDGNGAALAPTPSLRELDGLVAATAGAGVAVEVRTEGSATSLPTGLDLCAYRIVQEALTNVRKHARATRATVVVEYRPDAVSLSVTDDGPAAARAAAGGHGLVGMRERVALYGGTLDAGPGPSGGFRVAAVLPLASVR